MAGIDNIRSGQTMTSTTRSAQRSDSSTQSSQSGSVNQTPQDSVSLSQQSKDIGAMHSNMAQSPSFDSAKVAAIKEAIANGSYSVDPEKLADNMIKFEDELGGF
ncbi:negative regulator of flagellin synthesis FlgM [Vibrio astriarenae]|uniref:Negative regulator of flagellin synthesis n=1 Tax=Vibrio astriarenae TaxID=1481923 RepID=A0A7Z2YEA8_9VIBR|nr:flagellar biosynthesis anti-sigma factor FlgM [Vibrio astriarenae]QIA63934.1 flagellar biosynthesis anti-sigma factor FlgM [Vibrio astriarenae]GAL12692.1 negative regulator of flagellin synthesis FlgM [Vibrio sp. C7]